MCTRGLFGIRGRVVAVGDSVFVGSAENVVVDEVGVVEGSIFCLLEDGTQGGVGRVGELKRGKVCLVSYAMGNQSESVCVSRTKFNHFRWSEGGVKALDSFQTGQSRFSGTRPRTGQADVPRIRASLEHHLDQSFTILPVVLTALVDVPHSRV